MNRTGEDRHGQQVKAFSCHKIGKGKAEGEALISNDDINFYLVEPKTGKVIERNHDLKGKCVTGKVLIFPSGKGSSVVQADGMYQLAMQDTQPSALVIQYPDTVLVASSIIMEMPMVNRLADEFYQFVEDGDYLELDADEGVIRVTKKEK